MSKMQKVDEKEDQRITMQKSEAELAGIETQIEHFRQRLKLLQSEERAEVEGKNERIEKNKESICTLQSEIDYLRLRYNRDKLGDEEILKKAFQKHPGEFGIMKGKKVQEVVDNFEDRLFDLTKHSDALRYQVQEGQTHLETLKKDLRVMEKRCDIGDDPDVHLHERAREVENEYQQTQMKILEVQQIEKTYEKIRDKLDFDLMTFPEKLDELEKEYQLQQVEIDRLVERESRANRARQKAKDDLQVTEIAAQNARQEKDNVLAEFSHVLEMQQVHLADPDFHRRRATAFTPMKLLAESELTHMKQEQEKELELFRNTFDQIKLVTGVTDIEDVEKRFSSQKGISENMGELKLHYEKFLYNLKKEKAQLEAQEEILLGANLKNTKKDLEEELKKLEDLHAIQTTRKGATQGEYDRITKTTANAKSSLWHLLQMMEYHLAEEVTPQASSTLPDIPLTELASIVQQKMEEVTARLDGKNIDSLMKEMKEKQPFLKKLEDDRLGAAPPKRKPKVQAAEEEQSSDGETRNRSELKKEAQNFANVKQKQKGRGRGINF